MNKARILNVTESAIHSVLKMPFTVLDVAHLGFWLVWCYVPIGHRSPWGLWTTRMRKWFRIHQKRHGGPTESAYGTLRLISSLLMALPAFLYFRTYTDAEQGMSIAQYVLINATIVMVKLWWVLFFDYRDSRGAFAMGIIGTTFGVTTVALCGVVVGRNAPAGTAEGWAAFSLFLAHALWVLYLTAVAWNWQSAMGVNRKQARLMDVK